MINSENIVITILILFFVYGMTIADRSDKGYSSSEDRESNYRSIGSRRR